MYGIPARTYQYRKMTRAIVERAKIALKFPMNTGFVLMSFKAPDETKTKSAVLTTQDRCEEALFTEEVKEYTQLNPKYKNSCCNLFSIVPGHCSDTIQTKL